jgi:hypothetical protein
MSIKHSSVRAVVWPVASVLAVAVLAVYALGTSSPTPTAAAATAPASLQSDYV